MGWKHRFSTSTRIVVGCQVLTVDGEGIASCDDGIIPATEDSLRRHPNWAYLRTASAAPQDEISPADEGQAPPSPDEILELREAGTSYKDVSAAIEELTGGLDYSRGWGPMIDAYTDWYSDNA